MSKRKKILISVVGILIVLTLFRIIQLSHQRKLEKEKRLKQAQVEKYTPVLVKKVVKGNLNKYISVSGDIHGIEEVMVLPDPDVSGKIQSILVKEGQYVRKGQIMFLIDRSIVGLKYAPAKVTAPISGTVGKINVVKGQTVGPQTPLAVIVNSHQLEVWLNIPEKYAKFVKPGIPAVVKVDSYPNEAFPARIYRVDKMVDRVSRTIGAKALILKGNDKLIAGMFATVDVLIGSVKNSNIIPADAILEDEKGYFVYVNDNGTAKIRRVKILLDSGDLVAVKGLKEGEEVVVLGKEILTNGMKIKAVKE